MQSAIRHALRPAARQVRKLRQELRASGLRRMGVSIARTAEVHGPVNIQIAAGSRIVILDRVVLNSLMRRNTLEARGPNVLKTVSASARIEIGQDSGLTSVTVSSASSIRIGSRVLIGAGTLITDSDHHVVAPDVVASRRHAGLPAPRPEDGVLIEDDVFIGARSIILKGVTIGRGSVIGAGSVVSGSIPEGVIAAGNPCRPIRELVR